LGEEEIRLAKKFYGWPENAQFLIPDGVIDHFKNGIGARGKKARDTWVQTFTAYEKQYPALAEQLVQMQHRQLPEGWDADLPVFPADAKGMAGRVASSKALNAIANKVPWLVGGSADLAPSTKTLINDPKAGSLSRDNALGRNIHFGIRENGMASIINGLALSKMRPYGSTFLTFSDYARPGIRLSALMEIPVLYIFTHDSIGVGEDGPTHQPIEHLASLRAIPGLVVMRPADANEVSECWRMIMQMVHEPVALILSRQDLPTFDRARYGAAAGVQHGAYILADAKDGDPEVILIATGSEVQLCVNAYEELTAQGIKARVVSMPSFEIFDRQSSDYKESVLPSKVIARVAVEQASAMGWRRHVGDHGDVIAMHTFGKSAPLAELQEHFGFKPANIVKTALSQIHRVRAGK
jgi:transketolase